MYGVQKCDRGTHNTIWRSRGLETPCLQQFFPNIFGHGTRFDIVNINGTLALCGSSFIK